MPVYKLRADSAITVTDPPVPEEQHLAFYFTCMNQETKQTIQQLSCNLENTFEIVSNTIFVSFQSQDVPILGRLMLTGTFGNQSHAKSACATRDLFCAMTSSVTIRSWTAPTQRSLLESAVQFVHKQQHHLQE